MLLVIVRVEVAVPPADKLTTWGVKDHVGGTGQLGSHGIRGRKKPPVRLMLLSVMPRLARITETCPVEPC